MHIESTLLNACVLGEDLSRGLCPYTQMLRQRLHCGRVKAASARRSLSPLPFMVHNMHSKNSSGDATLMHIRLMSSLSSAAGSGAAAPAAASAIVPASQQPQPQQQQQQALAERPGRDRIALPGRPPRAKAEAVDPMDPVSLASSPAKLAITCFGTGSVLNRQGPAPYLFMVSSLLTVTGLAISYPSWHQLLTAFAAAVGVLRRSAGPLELRAAGRAAQGRRHHSHRAPVPAAPLPLPGLGAAPEPAPHRGAGAADWARGSPVGAERRTQTPSSAAGAERQRQRGPRQHR